MKLEDIQGCTQKGCLNTANGIGNSCLRHSKDQPGYEELKEELAELCNCGSHVGYYTPFGFALVDPNMNTRAIVEPDNCIVVVCDSCASENEIVVIQAMLPDMPKRSTPKVVNLDQRRAEISAGQ